MRVAFVIRILLPPNAAGIDSSGFADCDGQRRCRWRTIDSVTRQAAGNIPLVAARHSQVGLELRILRQ